MSTADPDSIGHLQGLLSLVIPAHNEAENLPRVLRAARTALADLADDYEIVIVDDGSTDATVAVARAEMAEEAQRLRIVSHSRKSGYGITVADGLRSAQGQWVAFMDGDGQFDPMDLRLLAARSGAADLITGWRQRRADPWHRSVVSHTFNILVRLLYGIRYRDVDCGFKLMRRDVLVASAPLLARSALLNTEIYFKTKRSGMTVAQVGLTHHPRLAGVRSGGRLLPILRAIRELVLLRVELARRWSPPGGPPA